MNKQNYNPIEEVLEKIKEKGGWVNTHSHLDRAYSLTSDTFALSNSYLKEKWHLVDDMKRNSSVDDIYFRMEKAINYMLEQIQRYFKSLDFSLAFCNIFSLLGISVDSPSISTLSLLFFKSTFNSL